MSAKAEELTIVDTVFAWRTGPRKGKFRESHAC
jgi:hypothetical protein